MILTPHQNGGRIKLSSVIKNLLPCDLYKSTLATFAPLQGVLFFPGSAAHRERNSARTASDHVQRGAWGSVSREGGGGHNPSIHGARAAHAQPSAQEVAGL